MFESDTVSGASPDAGQLREEPRHQCEVSYVLLMPLHLQAKFLAGVRKKRSERAYKKLLEAVSEAHAGHLAGMPKSDRKEWKNRLDEAERGFRMYSGLVGEVRNRLITKLRGRL